MIYLQTYARREQLDETLIYYSLSILSAASTFGRLIPNVSCLGRLETQPLMRQSNSTLAMAMVRSTF